MGESGVRCCFVLCIRTTLWKQMVRGRAGFLSRSQTLVSRFYSFLVTGLRTILSTNRTLWIFYTDLTFTIKLKRIICTGVCMYGEGCGLKFDANNMDRKVDSLPKFICTHLSPEDVFHKRLFAFFSGILSLFARFFTLSKHIFQFLSVNIFSVYDIVHISVVLFWMKICCHSDICFQWKLG